MDHMATFMMEVSIGMRAYMSGIHMNAARYFSGQAATLEESQGANPSTELIYCVMACIASSVGYLEATINEFYTDAHIRHHSHGTKHLSEADQLLAGKMAKRVNQLSTIKKYDQALKCLRNAPIDRDGAIFENAHTLTVLRNHLIHAKPETETPLPSNGVPLAKLNIENRVRGKFNTNPRFQGVPAKAFIQEYLSSGCANWAISSARNFTEHFFSTLGVSHP